MPHNREEDQLLAKAEREIIEEEVRQSSTY